MKQSFSGLFAANLLFASAFVSQALAYSAKDVPAFNCASVMITPDSIHWALPDDLSCNCLLRMGGEAGVRSKSRCISEDSLYLDFQNANGQQQPDGHYQYQLISTTEIFLDEIRAAMASDYDAKLQALRTNQIKPPLNILDRSLLPTVDSNNNKA